MEERKILVATRMDRITKKGKSEEQFWWRWFGDKDRKTRLR